MLYATQQWHDIFILIPHFMGEIYIVDDDFDIINSLGIWLRRKGYGVRAFSGSVALFEGIQMNPPDAILLDVKLGTEDGREVCKEIRKRYNKAIPVILFSSAFHSIRQLKDSCADDFINKGATLREITEILQEHMKLEDE